VAPTTYGALPAGVTWMSKPVRALLPVSVGAVQCRCTVLRAPKLENAVGAAGTLDKRFTNPRGDEAPRGLGLSERQIDEIADFVENGLYDPSFKDTFMPSENDLAYSKNRPDLAALGAKDGQLLSGRAIDNNDPLSRRDQGLEFLDVTGEVKRDLVEGEESRQNPKHVWRFTNTSESVVDTHLLDAEDLADVADLEEKLIGYLSWRHGFQSSLNAV